MVENSISGQDHRQFELHMVQAGEHLIPAWDVRSGFRSTDVISPDTKQITVDTPPCHFWTVVVSLDKGVFIMSLNLANRQLQCIIGSGFPEQFI